MNLYFNFYLILFYRSFLDHCLHCFRVYLLGFFVKRLNVQTFVEKFFRKLLDFYSELFTCHLAAASMRRSYIHCNFLIVNCIIKNQSEQTSVKDFNDHLASHLCYLNVQTFVEKLFQKLLNFYSELFICHLAAASMRR